MTGLSARRKSPLGLDAGLRAQDGTGEACAESERGVFPAERCAGLALQMTLVRPKTYFCSTKGPPIRTFPSPPGASPLVSPSEESPVTPVTGRDARPLHVAPEDPAASRVARRLLEVDSSVVGAVALGDQRVVQALEDADRALAERLMREDEEFRLRLEGPSYVAVPEPESDPPTVVIGGPRNSAGSGSPIPAAPHSPPGVVDDTTGERGGRGR